MPSYTTHSKQQQLWDCSHRLRYRATIHRTARVYHTCMVLPAVDAVLAGGYTLSALLVFMSVAGVALLCATALTCSVITRSSTASERGGVLLQGDRFQTQITPTSHSSTAETYAHVDLPHTHVAACAAAPGRQSCSVVSDWGYARSLLCCWLACCLCCVQTQKKVMVRTYNTHERAKRG